MTYNLADLFESVADAVPERTAIISSERRLSYGELDERATRLANCWAGLGIGHGDHIGLQLRNGSEYLEGMLAAYKLRAVPINVNLSLRGRVNWNIFTTMPTWWQLSPTRPLHPGWHR